MMRHPGSRKARSRAGVWGPRVESLERRALLSVTGGDPIAQVPVNTIDVFPPTLYVPLAATNGITEYSGPFQYAEHIVTGPDGNLWVTSSGSSGGWGQDNTIVSVRPNGTTQATYSVPTNNPGLGGLTVGPDGALWFTETVAGKIGRITTGGQVTEFPLPTVSVDVGFPSGPIQEAPIPTDIVSGADGALWFNEGLLGIGRITTDGQISRFPVAGAQVDSLAFGPDKALWFTNTEFKNTIGRMTADGTVTMFPLPQDFSEPTDIQAGPDGALWFLETIGQKVGRITTDGQISEFALPKLDNQLGGFTFGPDGNLWITASAYYDHGATLIRMTPSGALNTFDLANSTVYPMGITVGPDKALWFTEFKGDAIGRVDPSNLPAPTLDRPLKGGNLSYEGTFVPGQAVQFPEIPHNNTGALATFYGGDTAATASDFSVQIDWGDGQTSAGTVELFSDGSYIVGGSHVYAQPGNDNVAVGITERPGPNSPAGHSLTLNDTVDLLAQPLLPNPLPPPISTTIPIPSPGSPSGNPSLIPLLVAVPLSPIGTGGGKAAPLSTALVAGPVALFEAALEGMKHPNTHATRHKPKVAAHHKLKLADAAHLHKPKV